MTRRDWGDLIAAAALAALGAYVLIRSFSYGIGPATRMGSGNVPMILGGILMALALWIAVAAWRRSGQRAKIAWRPLAGVTAAIAAFCLLLPLAGFLPAVVCTIVLCELADPQVSLKGTVALVIVVGLLAWLIFAVGLQINLPIVRGF